MTATKYKGPGTAVIIILALLLFAAATVHAQHNPSVPGVVDGVSGIYEEVDGISNRTFTLTAKSGFIDTPEGNSVFIWGFSDADGPGQYAGVTLIVNQGDRVTVNLVNKLDENVSLVFPGQEQVVTDPAGTNPGVLTEEAAPDETVSYTFTAAHPGTYLYHSGTRQELQVGMGLFGALIVRPVGFDPAAPRAYEHPESAYDREYLFLLSEIDPVIHRLVERGRTHQVDFNRFFPTYWFINGRNAPDTMFPAFAGWLPSQPYNCMPMMYPGERVLFRVIGAGRDLHPLHHHGNHARVIAQDGRVLDSGEGITGAIDLSYEVFTIQSVPGQTVDAIFTWTGEKMGWDIYGHTSKSDPMMPGEDPDDHGEPFPVLLPDKGDLTFGGFWSGSPFLGALGSLPPGEGGLNPMGGFVYMVHSHTEKEMTNNDVFPGGLMTMLIVMPPMEPMEPPPLVPGENPIMGREGGR